MNTVLTVRVKRAPPSVKIGAVLSTNPCTRIIVCRFEVLGVVYPYDAALDRPKTQLHYSHEHICVGFCLTCVAR